MDLELAPEQEELRAAVRRFLEDRAPVSPWVRERLEGPRGTTEEVWKAMAGLGLTGPLVPESLGGSGMGMVDVGVVSEELGRAVHPGPFLSSAVGATSALLNAADPAGNGELLSGLADGSVVATLAVLEPGQRRRWESPATRADNGRLTGLKKMVPDGASADVVLVLASDDAGAGSAPRLYAVSAADPGVTVTPTPAVDGTRKQATVRLERAAGRPVGGEDDRAAVARALDDTLVAMVADGVGAAQAALDMAVAYAKERVQFGRPIGSFQAVQHLCADMLQAVELARGASYYATWAAESASPEEAHRAATMARAYAGDALCRVGASAIQVLGGIGFTWDHDAHLYYKRLLSLQQAGGTTADHLEELASLVV